MSREPTVLALNVGSSSLKAAVRDPRPRLRLHVSGLDGPRARLSVRGAGGLVDTALLTGGWPAALAEVADAVALRGRAPDAVVHRIVHGSTALPTTLRADAGLLARLRAEAARDPLHLPRQLDVVDEGRRRWPGAAVLLCPDSGFHADLPDEATALPLSDAARSSGLRRWGFHGLAVRSVVDTLPGLGSAVVVHLGSGCSATAVQDGRPRSTTMALSPAGGIPSLTRSGDLDPEVVLALLERHDGDVAAVRDELNRESGLAGLAGGRRDVVALLRADPAEDPDADLALRVFVRSVAMAVAAAVTTLDSWDALVFTGGIGSGSAEIRDRVCARLLAGRAEVRQLRGGPADRLAASGVRVHTVDVDEETVLDHEARTVLAGAP